MSAAGCATHRGWVVCFPEPLRPWDYRCLLLLPLLLVAPQTVCWLLSRGAGGMAVGICSPERDLLPFGAFGVTPLCVPCSG